jgi:exopolyphosphatase / guanosine-5'-triphosphate,3'-diphosphate pyrophosphatase
MSKRFAAVDIGSNTIKVTISDHLENDNFQKVFYKDFPSGLGKNMSRQNILDPSKLSECYQAIREIKIIIEERKVDVHEYVATHALREATNQREILASIKSNTGVDVSVITGEEEARLTLTAILMDFPAKENYACINAGGGSTELSYYMATASTKEQIHFFRFGAVNLYSRYLKNSPNIEVAINEIDELITREFKKISGPSSSEIDKVISIGGSIYNAAYIFRQDQVNFEQLKGMTLTVSDLDSVIDRLKTMNEEEKKNIPGLDHKRIDTVLPGMLIHYFFLKLMGKRELVISTRTLGDGLIYKMAKNVAS